jgi:hypothetical protein
MATEDRIQPSGANPTPAAPTTVTKTPAPTAPAPHGPHAKHPVADRFAEMWDGIKPYIDRKTMYVVVAVVLLVGIYFGWVWYNSESKKSNSERWEKWLTQSNPTEMRIAADKIKEKERKDKPGWLPPDPESPSYNAFDEAYQRQLLDDFAQANPDTIQARLTRIQLGRFLMLSVMRDISLDAGGRQPSPHAAEVLKTVADSYQTLASQLEDDPILQYEVILTEGKAREMLGEVSKAMELYHKLADSEKTKNTAAGKEATAALKRLETPATAAGGDSGREQAEKLASIYVKSAAR